MTRPSEWSRGWRVPAYPRFAPLLKASSTRARPMPRLAPVIKIVSFSMFIPRSVRALPRASMAGPRLLSVHPHSDHGGGPRTS